MSFWTSHVNFSGRLQFDSTPVSISQGAFLHMTSLFLCLTIMLWLNCGGVIHFRISPRFTNFGPGFSVISRDDGRGFLLVDSWIFGVVHYAIGFVYSDCITRRFSILIVCMSNRFVNLARFVASKCSTFEHATKESSPELMSFFWFRRNLIWFPFRCFLWAAYGFLLSIRGRLVGGSIPGSHVWCPVWYRCACFNLLERM